MRKGLLGIVAALFILTSCSEDVDLTAPYKDITVAYGLLDAKQDTHWIRIQKAFLGDDNALLYSIIPDSLYYPATMDAWILAYNASSVKVDSFHLTRLTNVFVKDPGVFASDSTVLYQGVRNLNLNYTYKLFIKKPNGDTTSAQTILTNDITMAYPPTSGTPLDWEPINIGQTKILTFRWVKDNNSYAYQLGFTFHYQEWTLANPTPVDTSFTYYFPMFKDDINFTCNSNQICYEIDKPIFYQMITDHIPEDLPGTPNNDIRLRRFISMDVKILQASYELYSYITINAPSLSYVQKVSAYTNVENGLGIFGSRTSGGLNGLSLDTQTKDSLRLGQYTYQLNFQP